VINFSRFNALYCTLCECYKHRFTQILLLK